MSKKGTKALASATLMSLVLTTALSAGPVQAAAGKVTRTSGVDRYATAAQVAKTNWEKGATDVVLVNGENYPDAVSASALAKKLNAPILLTKAGELNTDAKSALETLKPTNVYVVGGNASVNGSLRDTLKATYKLVELGGSNRYETNVAVAKKLVELGVKADNVLLVGGEGFSDALSVAPVAAAKGQILLLGCNNADTMKSVVDFVKANSSKVTVVGTSNVISEDMYKTLGASDRVNGGASRFETNINVLNKFATDLKADKLFVANASGDGFADALVASAIAGKTASPLVLVDKEGTSATNNAITYIKGKATKTTDLNVIGGTGVVSDATVNAIDNAVNPNNPGPGNATVQSIEAVDLNQVKVVFNTDVDEDSAENLDNYEIDGAKLTAGNAGAVLQDDNRTLLITLATPKDQLKDYTVSVKKGVLSADKQTTVPALDQKVTFKDTAVPTIKTVSVQGNNKLTVEFSEPVKMTTGGAMSAGINELASKFKVNGQNIVSFGLSNADSEVKDAVRSKKADGTYETFKGYDVVWSNKVEFYFNSPLPTGSNTLKISDADNVLLYDGATFGFKETSTQFNVDSITTKPVIKEVTSSTDGKIYVKFDRPMDKVTAQTAINYKLNGAAFDPAVAGGAVIAELKDNDCTVKIKNFDTTKLNLNSNTLTVTNKVKDAFGNKVDDDTNINFTQTKDETKPTVSSVTVIDSETIRVKFTKDVLAKTATQKSNYKLKDADGTDISNHIKAVNNASGESNNGSNSNTWDVKIYKTAAAANADKPGTTTEDPNTDWSITGAKYTLTIKNIVDTTTKQNVMDDYNATINGTDTVAPKVLGTFKKADGDRKVVAFFNEAMDSDTLNKAVNYKFKNKSGDTKALPDSATITVGSDNKSVTIEFPSSYYISSGTDDGRNSDNVVTNLVITNVKDQSGNLLDGIAYSDAIKPTSGAGVVASHIKDKSFKLSYATNSDDVIAEFNYDRTIDAGTLAAGEFAITDKTGLATVVSADSISVSGGKVTLRFKDTDPNTKINQIKALGSDARLKVTASATKDEAGITLANVTPSTTEATVYDNLLQPKTVSDAWFVSTAPTLSGTFAFAGNNVVLSDTITIGTSQAAIGMVFDTPLDVNSGVKVDDFTFSTVDGKTLTATTAKVTGNTVVFILDYADNTDIFANVSDMRAAFVANNIKAKAVSSIQVRSQKDRDSNYANYKPSDDDLKNRVIKNLK